MIALLLTTLNYRGTLSGWPLEDVPGHKMTGLHYTTTQTKLLAFE